MKTFKKLIAPITFSVIIIAAIVLYYGFIATVVRSTFATVIFVILIVALVSAMIYVLVQRIHEMKEEDKNDLSKY